MHFFHIILRSILTLKDNQENFILEYHKFHVCVLEKLFPELLDSSFIFFIVFRPFSDSIFEVFLLKFFEFIGFWLLRRVANNWQANDSISNQLALPIFQSKNLKSLLHFKKDYLQLFHELNPRIFKTVLLPNFDNEGRWLIFCYMVGFL